MVATPPAKEGERLSAALDGRSWEGVGEGREGEEEADEEEGGRGIWTAVSMSDDSDWLQWNAKYI